MRVELCELPRELFRNPLLNIDIGEKLLRLFWPTAHRKSLRLAQQTESHHKLKIDEFFSGLLGRVGGFDQDEPR